MGSFELIGRTAHEWIGVGMFVLFINHHILNRNWSKNLFRGSYLPFRMLQTVLAALVFLAMLGSFISAVLISREVFAFLPIKSGRAFGRTLHLLCAYWGFLLLSLHLGFHWSTILGMTGRLTRKPSRTRRIALSILGACVVLHGIYALIHRDIPSYLFLQNRFVFFDFKEPPIFFFLDNLAAMGLFVWIGHYLAKGVHLLQKREANR